MDDAGAPLPHAHRVLQEHKQGGLGQLASTAICGNDITSSCLYVSALCIGQAGRWAPLALLIVAAVLWMYRGIYAEVVGALPLNGGAYNALLNTTSKSRASVAACLTILSYMATAVISASEAMHYVASLAPSLPVFEATIGLLGCFCLLTVMGISESAIVAIVIFVLHIVSLTLLLGVGVVFLAGHGLDVLGANLSTPTPGGMLRAIFFGFSVALLGISGFESSANFVEEQAEGVFPKTLRNMWGAVSFFNPAMALLALALVPLADVPGHHDTLLAHMGDVTGGAWLSWLVGVDAALVLSGAVLTSYVGVGGLVRRMTLDRCLPQFLLKTNRRGTSHRILVGFFLLTVSILLITRGELEALAGVYTLSFLAVMALFGAGNILLKVRRDGLPRPTRAAWPTVLGGIAAVGLGMLGNALLKPEYLGIFLRYFVPSVLVIAVMLNRVVLLQGLLFTARGVLAGSPLNLRRVTSWIEARIEQIKGQQVVFFTRGDNIANLNLAMLYVRENEHTNRLKLVTVLRPGEQLSTRLAQDVDFLDQAYPEIDIEYVQLEGEFGPELIQRLSKVWRIPTNFMFIGSPGDGFMYGLADLGGVRLII